MILVALIQVLELLIIIWSPWFKAIKTELDRRTVIYEKKSELQNIEHIANTINKVERILGEKETVYAIQKRF